MPRSMVKLALAMVTTVVYLLSPALLQPAMATPEMCFDICGDPESSEYQACVIGCFGGMGSG